MHHWVRKKEEKMHIYDIDDYVTLPYCNKSVELILTSCLHLTTTGKINLRREESVWPITPPLLTLWFSATMAVMLWYWSIFDLNIFFNEGWLSILNCDALPKRPTCVCQVGQVHRGLMGILQRAMVRSCPHVWFERAEMKDRHLVTKRLVPLSSRSIFFQICFGTTFSPVFSHRGCFGMRRHWHFPGRALIIRRWTDLGKL